MEFRGIFTHKYIEELCKWLAVLGWVLMRTALAGVLETYAHDTRCRRLICCTLAAFTGSIGRIRCISFDRYTIEEPRSALGVPEVSF